MVAPLAQKTKIILTGKASKTIAKGILRSYEEAQTVLKQNGFLSQVAADIKLKTTTRGEDYVSVRLLDDAGKKVGGKHAMRVRKPHETVIDYLKDVLDKASHKPDITGNMYKTAPEKFTAYRNALGHKDNTEILGNMPDNVTVDFKRQGWFSTPKFWTWGHKKAVITIPTADGKSVLKQTLWKPRGTTIPYGETEGGIGAFVSQTYKHVDVLHENLLSNQGKVSGRGIQKEAQVWKKQAKESLNAYEERLPQIVSENPKNPDRAEWLIRDAHDTQKQHLLTTSDALGKSLEELSEHPNRFVQGRNGVTLEQHVKTADELVNRKYGNYSKRAMDSANNTLRPLYESPAQSDALSHASPAPKTNLSPKASPSPKTSPGVEKGIESSSQKSESQSSEASSLSIGSKYTKTSDNIKKAKSLSEAQQSVKQAKPETKVSINESHESYPEPSSSSARSLTNKSETASQASSEGSDVSWKDAEAESFVQPPNGLSTSKAGIQQANADRYAQVKKELMGKKLVSQIFAGKGQAKLEQLAQDVAKLEKERLELLEQKDVAATVIQRRYHKPESRVALLQDWKRQMKENYHQAQAFIDESTLWLQGNSAAQQSEREKLEKTIKALHDYREELEQKYPKVDQKLKDAEQLVAQARLKAPAKVQAGIEQQSNVQAGSGSLKPANGETPSSKPTVVAKETNGSQPLPVQKREFVPVTADSTAALKKDAEERMFVPIQASPQKPASVASNLPKTQSSVPQPVAVGETVTNRAPATDASTQRGGSSTNLNPPAKQPPQQPTVSSKPVAKQPDTQQDVKATRSVSKEPQATTTRPVQQAAVNQEAQNGNGSSATVKKSATTLPPTVLKKRRRPTTAANNDADQKSNTLPVGEPQVTTTRPVQQATASQEAQQQQQQPETKTHSGWFRLPSFFSGKSGNE